MKKEGREGKLPYGVALRDKVVSCSNFTTVSGDLSYYPHCVGVKLVLREIKQLD